MIGTPSYMAPEQAHGDLALIGPATDVYGLGAVLYHLLTGHPPFAGGSSVSVLYRVVTEPPELPRRHNAGVPEALEAICLRCLEKDPARRYPSAAALVEALDAWLAEDDQPAPAEPQAETGDTLLQPPAPMPRSSSWRRSLLIGATGAALLAAVPLLLLALRKPGGEERRSESGSNAGPVVPPPDNGPPPVREKQQVGGVRVEEPPAVEPLAVAFPPPPLRKDFKTDIELFDCRDGQLVESRPGKDGARLLTEGECVLRLTVSRKARVAVFSVAADGTVIQLFPNDYESKNQLEANVPREIPARELRDDYAIGLRPSRGLEQLRVLATTGELPDLKGQKDGPFMAFRNAAERNQLTKVRDMILKPRTGFAEVMVPYIVEKARN
jgi:hypothetical protein